MPNLEDLPLNEETVKFKVDNTEDEFKVSQLDSMSNTIQSKDELNKVIMQIPQHNKKEVIITTKDSMGKNSIISEADSAFEE